VTTPGPPDPAKAGAGDALPSPLAAVDDMRTTAKWTLAVVGAVGAALVSAGPLAAVGQVHGFGNAVVAGIGLACALAGVMLSIWFTTKVLAPRLTTPAVFQELRTTRSLTIRPWFVNQKTSVRLARLTTEIDQNATYFFGELATSVDDLLTRRRNTLSGIQAVGEAIAADTTPAAFIGPLAAQLARLQSDLARIDACLRSLISLAHAWLVEGDLKRSRLATLGGGLLVVVGAVLFFTVTGNNGPTYVPVVTTTPAPSPTASPSTSASATTSASAVPSASSSATP
jgi:hypothetical protein